MRPMQFFLHIHFVVAFIRCSFFHFGWNELTQMHFSWIAFIFSAQKIAVFRKFYSKKFCRFIFKWNCIWIRIRIRIHISSSIIALKKRQNLCWEWASFVLSDPIVVRYGLNNDIRRNQISHYRLLMNLLSSLLNKWRPIFSSNHHSLTNCNLFAFQ